MFLPAGLDVFPSEKYTLYIQVDYLPGCGFQPIRRHHIRYTIFHYVAVFCFEAAPKAGFPFLRQPLFLLCYGIGFCSMKTGFYIVHNMSVVKIQL
jgi:hypothetical protein